MDEGTIVPGSMPIPLFDEMKSCDYVPPMLIVLEVKVEKGFSASNGNDGGVGIPDWEIV